MQKPWSVAVVRWINEWADGCSDAQWNDVKESLHNWMKEAMKQWTKGSVNQCLNSTTQWNNKETNHNEPTVQRLNESVAQRASEIMNHSRPSESVNQRFKESVSHWIREPMSQWANEWKNQINQWIIGDSVIQRISASTNQRIIEPDHHSEAMSQWINESLVQRFSDSKSKPVNDWMKWHEMKSSEVKSHGMKWKKRMKHEREQ